MWRKEGRTTQRRSGVILAVLTCGLLAGVAAPLFASARTEDAIDAWVEAAILQEDWPTVDRLLGSQHQLPPEARLIRGHALLALNRNTESSCLFLSASSDADTLAWLNWAEAFAARRPESAIAHYLRGDALARSQRWADAGSAFETALGLSPNHPLALDALGVTQAVRGQFDQALVTFLKATRSAPGLADAHASLGSLWIQWRRGAKGSVASFDRALRIAPEFALALYSRGAVQALLGRFDEARQDLDHGLAKSGCMSGTLAAGVTELVGRMTAEEEIRLALADGSAPAMVMERYTKEIERNGPGQIGGPLSKLLTLSSRYPELQSQAVSRLSQISRSDPVLGDQIQAGLSRIQAFGSQMGPLAERAQTLQQSSPARAWINPMFSGAAGPTLPGGLPLSSPFNRAGSQLEQLGKIAGLMQGPGPRLPYTSALLQGMVTLPGAWLQDQPAREAGQFSLATSHLTEASAKVALQGVAAFAKNHATPAFQGVLGPVLAVAPDLAPTIGGMLGRRSFTTTPEDWDHVLTAGTKAAAYALGYMTLGRMGNGHYWGSLAAGAAELTIDVGRELTRQPINDFVAWSTNVDTRRNFVRSYEQLTQSWAAHGMAPETFSQTFGRDNLKGIGFSDREIDRFDARVPQSQPPSKFSALSIPPQELSNALKLGATDQLRRMAGFPLPPGCGFPGARCGAAGVESLSGLAGKTLQQLPAPTLPGGFKTSLEEVVWVGDNWPLQARYGLGYRMPPQTTPKPEPGGTDESR